MFLPCRLRHPRAWRARRPAPSQKGAPRHTFTSLSLPVLAVRRKRRPDDSGGAAADSVRPTAMPSTSVDVGAAAAVSPPPPPPILSSASSPSVCGLSPAPCTSTPVLSLPSVAGSPCVTTHVFPVFPIPPTRSPVADVAAAAASAAAAGAASGLCPV
eukprot:gene5977-biopygen3585